MRNFPKIFLSTRPIAMTTPTWTTWTRRGAQEYPQQMYGRASSRRHGHLPITLDCIFFRLVLLEHVVDDSVSIFPTGVKAEGGGRDGFGFNLLPGSGWASEFLGGGVFSKQHFLSWPFLATCLLGFVCWPHFALWLLRILALTLAPSPFLEVTRLSIFNTSWSPTCRVAQWRCDAGYLDSTSSSLAFPSLSFLFRLVLLDEHVDALCLLLALFFRLILHEEKVDAFCFVFKVKVKPVVRNSSKITLAANHTPTYKHKIIPRSLLPRGNPPSLPKV